VSSKFNPERRAIILEALMTNPSIASAAVKAGVTESTLRVWLQKGEEGNPEYQEFAQQAATARAAMKDEIVASLFHQSRVSAFAKFVSGRVCECEAHRFAPSEKRRRGLVLVADR
jgi:transposase-like protein